MLVARDVNERLHKFVAKWLAFGSRGTWKREEHQRPGIPSRPETAVDSGGPRNQPEERKWNGDFRAARRGTGEGGVDGGREENIQNLARLFHGRGRHADESVSNKVLTVSNGETWRTRPRSSTAGNHGRREGNASGESVVKNILTGVHFPETSLSAPVTPPPGYLSFVFIWRDTRPRPASPLLSSPLLSSTRLVSFRSHREP